LTHRPRRPSVAGRPSAVAASRDGVPAGVKEGSLHRAGSGFVRVVGGLPQAFQPSPRKDAAELAALCDLRNTVTALLDAQVQAVDDARYLALQGELNARYDRYMSKFGPLNRFRLVRTGRTDPVTGADLYPRLHPRLGGFADDPDYRTILALEDFDPDSQTAAKAAIFTRRLLAPAAVRYGADTADDALAISLDETGRVDIDRIAELLDLTADEALAQLAERVYRDPATREVVPAEQYLSGDVAPGSMPPGRLPDPTPPTPRTSRPSLACYPPISHRPRSTPDSAPRGSPPATSRRSARSCWAATASKSSTRR
ncbi:MAG: hypothetical protein ACRD0D_12315, partial [Acidimicrobiales bacterium]